MNLSKKVFNQAKFEKKKFTFFTLFMGIFFLILISGNINVIFSQDNTKSYYEKEAAFKTAMLEKMRSMENIQATDYAGYDAKYYHIDLEIDPSTHMFYGKVTIRGQIIANSLNYVELDLSDLMTVSSIVENATTLNFTHQNNILHIDLGKSLQTNESFEITVNYSGVPGQGGVFGSVHFDENNGVPMIWTLSSPFGARDWWPCKDIPADKADSVDIVVTVPSNLIVASNGLLREEIELAGNKKQYWWHESYPIVTYLVSLAIHNYTTYSDWFKYSPTDSMEIQFYMFPQNVDATREINLRVKDMLQAYSDIIGEYPFINEKYGHAECFFGGGMEHQTLTSIGFFGEWLVAHEVSHMWWGDMITCRDFHHIWVNEGFAKYSESLWFEYAYGEEAYKQHIRLSEYRGPGTTYVEDPQNDAIYDINLSYNKGAYVLHMLRNIIGEDNFFNALKTFADDVRYKYKTATTADFQEVCETISGLDLNKYFQQWIYGEYYPIYSYGFSADSLSNGYHVNLTIDQVQENTGLFWMPIDIKVTTVSGEQVFVVWDSLETQTFGLFVEDKPISVELDPDNWILKETREKLISPKLDQGALVVNGLAWSLGNDVYNSYENKAFWGNTQISFWDIFDEPTKGYPESLPAPIGNGEIPVSILGNYSTIIWLAHNYNGDNVVWNNAPIIDYLNEGGNLILITRRGQEFMNNAMSDYLGINWDPKRMQIIVNCENTYGDLIDMNLIKNHTMIDLFDTTLTQSYSTLLFKTTESFDEAKGMGIWAKPDSGGQFVYIAGRPYLFNSEDLKTNLEYLLTNFMDEPVSMKDESNVKIPKEFVLYQNYPNPFNPVTSIKYDLPKSTNVILKIYNTLGQEVRTLVNEYQTAGNKSIVWDGTDNSGQSVSSGVYIYRIQNVNNEKWVQSKKMVILR